MPLFGPSLAGRSNRTAGTPALTRCAAIWAPMTPAPSTATFLTMKLLTCDLRCWFVAAGRRLARRRGSCRSLLADPGPGATEERHPDESAHLSPPTQPASVALNPFRMVIPT